MRLGVSKYFSSRCLQFYCEVFSKIYKFFYSLIKFLLNIRVLLYWLCRRIYWQRNILQLIKLYWFYRQFNFLYYFHCSSSIIVFKLFMVKFNRSYWQGRNLNKQTFNRAYKKILFFYKKY